MTESGLRLPKTNILRVDKPVRAAFFERLFQFQLSDFMANTKQAQKYIRKTETRTARNRAVISRLRTLSKKLTKIDAASDEAKTLAKEYSSALDKAAKRNIVHANYANRRKAALSKLLFAAAK